MTESSALPVVFVHGLWLHASSWQPWMDLFAERGYRPIAPGWPGEAATAEETRAHADELAGRGITEITTPTPGSSKVSTSGRWWSGTRSAG